MPTEEHVEIVSATRLGPDDFNADAPLGQSLGRLHFDRRLKARIFLNNTLGLPLVYNQRIQSPSGPDVTVFIHDDVWIEDPFFVDRIVEGLDHFDIVGVAGNQRRAPHQPSWHMREDRSLDRDNLSGSVSHGRPFGAIRHFGPSGIECELLDGVLLAARRTRLWKAGVRFDPAFTFDFYDMDFCRTARAHGLRLGTWPIAISHRSAGNFASKEWEAARLRYFDKWKN